MTNNMRIRSGRGRRRKIDSGKCDEESLQLPTTSSNNCCSTRKIDEKMDNEEDIEKSEIVKNENPDCENSMKSERSEIRKRCSSLRWLSLPAWLFIFGMLIQPCSSIVETRCGSVDIRNTPNGLLRSRGVMDLGDSDSIKANNNLSNQINCTVIEGSFLITMIRRHENRTYTRDDFPVFPFLREITGSVMIFDANYLKSLSWIFPNLRVIGGQVLIQQYALVIFKNEDLEDIGLEHLTVIRNGGVRITDNKRLCHTRSIDWKHLTISHINDVVLDDAAEDSLTETGRICKKGSCVADPDQKICRTLEVKEKNFQSCWSDTTCQRVCQFERDENGGVGPGCDPNGEKCHEDCLGGCEKKNDPTACHACKNFHYQGRCIKECAKNLFVLINRRCVTEQKCLSLKPLLKDKPIAIKAVNGTCSDRCPRYFEEDPDDPRKCRECGDRCQIVCPTTTIDSYSKAQSIQDCNIIDGNLIVEFRAKVKTGSMPSIKDHLAKIHTITGYLEIRRTPSFLNLFMFPNLKTIGGKKLKDDKYALSVVENINLKKLFDPRINLNIERGSIRFHNNHLLCFRQITQFMEKLGRETEMSDFDQSTSSNGDKAVCEDHSFEVTLDMVTATEIQIAWPQFNTTNMDHRKFLGYEVFYKEVAEINPNMTIDDDRSACSDSWHSTFVESPGDNSKTVYHMITEYVRANRHYAIYVTTQVVIHEGARNAISSIMFATTQFSQPDPPTVSIQKVTNDSIELSWEPPIRPNGVITHYTISWRAIETDVAFSAETFCSKEKFMDKHRDETAAISMTTTTTPSPFSSDAVTMTSIFGGGGAGEGQCSAIKGCCECPQKSPDAEQTEEESGFENDVHNAVFVQKCNIDYDPTRCEAVWEPEKEELDPEELAALNKEIARKERRDLRREEANERRRKEMYRAIHTIRNSLQDYEAFTALVIRKRRAITSSPLDENKNETNSQKDKNRTYVTRKGVKKDTESQNDTATEKKSQLVMQDDEKQVAFPLMTINVTVDNTRKGPQTFRLENLKHFTLYSITVAACQDVKVPNNHCSPGSKASKLKRTKPLPNVDRVLNETIKFEYLNVTNNVRVTWQTPNNTNGGILGYHVYMKNLAIDASAQKECISAVSNWSSEVDGVVFKNPPDGEYGVEVLAYSLYGVGEVTMALEKVVIRTPGFWTLDKIILIVVMIILFVLLVSFILYKIIKKYYGKKVKQMADFMSSNPEYVIEQVYTPDDWELERDDLELLEEIGMGTFGKVFRGMGKDVLSKNGVTFGECAIKTVQDKANSEERLHFLLEANVMKGFDAPFIVKLFGVVSTGQPTLVVMEMMELGNLRDYLRSRRPGAEENVNNMPVPSKEQYHEWASMIADGMAYLESIKFCHRDLAARNIMVRADEAVKIGDFGMARDLYYHDYYKPTGKRLMPVRWMAPESLKDGRFDSKSDCWSYGIVLYEMLTLGQQPYQGLANDEVLNYIGMSRKILDKPLECPEYWYKVMKMCWRFTPRDRPSFAQIVHLLLPHVSDEFKEISYVVNSDMKIEEPESGDDEQHTEEDEADYVAEPGGAGTSAGGAATRPRTDSIAMKEIRPCSSRSSSSRSSLFMSRDSRKSSMKSLMNSSNLRLHNNDGHNHYPHHNHRHNSLDRISGSNSYQPLTNAPLGLANDHFEDGDYVEKGVRLNDVSKKSVPKSVSGQIATPAGPSNNTTNVENEDGYCLSNRNGTMDFRGNWGGEGDRLTSRNGSK